VYDLNTLFAQTEPAIQVLLTTFMGGLPEQKAQAYHDASPVNYVTSQGPPALIMYGTEDTIAPPAQAQQFMQKLQALGVAYEQVSYQSGHEIPPGQSADAWTKVFAFIGAHAGTE
jgi:dipeptidyl aminopeptidase/acylaminoacyl peptidase